VAAIIDRSTGSPQAPTATPAGGVSGPRLATVCGLAALVAGLVVGLGPLGDNSWMTHLATGRLLLDGEVVRADPYTYTSGGESWVLQSWLASLLYAAVEAVAGMQGLRLLTAACTALLAGLLWRLTAPAGSVVGRAVVFWVSILVGVGLWSERPLLLGLVALAGMLVLLEEDRDPRWIAVVFALWVNVHGSFPIGIAVLAALAVGRRLDGVRPDRELAALRWSVLGTVVGGVLNPYGPKLLMFPVALLTRQSSLAEVVEWQSPSFARTDARAFLVLLAMVVVGLVRTPRFRTALPAVLMTVAALLALRNVAVAAVVLVPFAAVVLRGVGGVTGDRRSPGHRLALVGLGTVAAVVTVAAVQGPALDLGGYPVAAVDRLEERGWHAPGIRWAHPDIAGNYLELRYGAEADAFVDDRFELHDPALLEDLMVLMRGGSGWGEVLDRHRVDLVLWPEDLPLRELLALHPDWEPAFAADGWSVFCRATGCPA
jgi:hypothetical protein